MEVCKMLLTNNYSLSVGRSVH